MKTPSRDDLRCLNHWPEGTNGYAQEEALLGDLLRLCELHGFGRVAQLTESIEEIWRGGEAAIKKHELDRKRRIELLKQSIDFLRRPE